MIRWPVAVDRVSVSGRSPKSQRLHAALLERRARLRERELRGLAELRAQRGEVAAARELAARRVDDAHVDLEVRAATSVSSQTSRRRRSPSARASQPRSASASGAAPDVAAPLRGTP